MFKYSRKFSCQALLAFASLAGVSSVALAQPVNNAVSPASDGQYIATAADCAACHTTPGGQPFAGGYAIQSPLGAIWSTNITPSKQYGIGNYTEEQFATAIRTGVTPEGTHLYPAMPYTAYALMSDQDVAALYHYLMTDVKPVEQPNKPTDLPFPFNIRASMILWDAIYGGAKPFSPDATKSDEYNRGAYLVNALEHCATCHTPRTFLMGQDDSRAFGGASLGSWYAPNISSDKINGIGGWSDQQLFDYLRTGHVLGLAQAAGPMAEAVEHSTQHLSDDDLHAIVTYLKQTAPMPGTAAQPRNGVGQPATDAESRWRGGAAGSADPGWTVYSGTCAACHGADGSGTTIYPSLFHNTTTGAGNPDNLIATILYGVQRNVNGEAIYMPGFGPGASFTERLSDQQMADVANFVLAQFGQYKGQVTVQDVARIEGKGGPSILLKLARFGIVAGAVVLVVILGLILLAFKRRSRKGHVS